MPVSSFANIVHKYEGKQYSKRNSLLNELLKLTYILYQQLGDLDTWRNTDSAVYLHIDWIYAYRSTALKKTNYKLTRTPPWVEVFYRCNTKGIIVEHINKFEATCWCIVFSPVLPYRSPPFVPCSLYEM
jgi:hypothetical protein